MIWKGLIVFTNCTKPLIIALSGDGYSFYNIGDVLMSTNYDEETIRAGDIVVFEVKGRDIPIVHRIIKLHQKNNGDVKYLTKGDGNVIDDRGLYSPEQLWLERKDIIGKVKGYIPYLGIVIIMMNNLFQLNVPAPILLIYFFVLMCRRWSAMIF